MYDYELLATDMIKLPTRALPRNWKAVTAADVAEMLRHAGVREPWRAPKLGCYSVAQCINNPLGYQSLSSAKSAVSKPAEHDCGVNDREPSRTKADRARDAIDEFRRAVPGAIAVFESSVAQSFRIYSSHLGRAQHLRAVQDLPQATARCETLKKVLDLLDSLPPRPRQRTRAWWRLDAAKLFEIYRDMIDVDAGISPDGPAVRLIKAALARMGYRRLPKHIESALRGPIDWRNEFLRRRFDEVMI